MEMSEGRSLESVINHVERLYSSRDPTEVNSLQIELQSLQKSEYGLELANVLMGQNSANCRFFGALTYGVAINIRRDKFSSGDVLSLVGNMEGHIFGLISSEGLEGNMVVIRKLFSDLSLLFIFHSNTYSDPLKIFYENLGASDNAGSKEAWITLILIFASILVEDVSKHENTTAIHKIIYDNVFLKVNNIVTGLSDLGSSLKIHLLALDCINSWVYYISVAEANSEVRYDCPKNMVNYLFDSLNLSGVSRSSDESLEPVNKTLLVFTEISEMNPRMLDRESKLRLHSSLFEPGNFGEEFMSKVVFSDLRLEYEDEVGNFVNLIIVFLQNDLLNLAKQILEEPSTYKIKVLLSLTNISGIPMIDETLSDQFLTFWEDFINIFIDDEESFRIVFESEPNEFSKFINRRNEIVSEICGIYWNKIHLPPFAELEPVKVEFLHYRSGVADLFIAAYSLVSLPLYDRLTSKLIEDTNSLGKNNNMLLDIESTLYLIYKITEDYTFYDPDNSPFGSFVGKIFESGILNSFGNLSTNDNSLKYFYFTFNNFLASVTFYLKGEHGKEFLGPILRLLIPMILGGSTSLSLNVSKTMLKICQECSQNLIPYTSDIEALLVEMLKNPGVDALIRQRLFSSYTSIIQYLKNPVEIGKILFYMINEIYNSAAKVMSANSSNNEELEDYLISLISCVCQIARACEIPEEIDEFYTPEEQEIVDNYWKQDPSNVKDVVLRIIRLFSIDFPPFIHNATCTEKCCNILKSGVREDINGPFKFPIEIIFNYLVSKVEVSDTGSIPSIYSLVETVIVTNYNRIEREVLQNLIDKVFTQNLEALKSDPYAIKSAVELFAVILERKPSLILDLPVFQSTILKFSLDGLSANENFIIKPVSRFWVAIISLKKGSEYDHALIRDLFTTKGGGQQLCSNLVKSFISAARSNLDYYYPIFRNLLGKYPLESKTWFLQAFHDLNHEKLNDHLINIIVNKIMITRGQRSAHDILKKVWLQLNGLIEFNSKNF
ncbi:Piso0_000827 [Millerozyma farinosa CBS 7064]|uniref:Piso0_000827 protein n=1 Tax=Pichia sorbitophila (strain ATCC MYA-4447 / BCRC 22081 / CBS 7064 / NBRC 10061 / NRRL Y-12695) TaxID=559304 RepID=G8YRM3_PICSO|nr:Piso0_000827 [Millerozyma farinosa CBS 7064]